MTVIGNTQLVQYGIQTERSDVRAHVCVTAKSLYVYPTANGIACLDNPRYREVNVPTGSFITARGRIVPPTAIDGCMLVPIPVDILARIPILRTDTPTVKGRKATEIVAMLLRQGFFPAVLAPLVITATDLQYEGVDIVATANIRIQVKCDFDGGGSREIGCTGNLFLQTAECNPYGAH